MARERAGAYGPTPTLGFSRAARGDRNNWIPLAAFADANQMAFRRQTQDPTYPGLIFDLGWRRWVNNHVFVGTGAFADAGQLDYDKVTGENQTYSPPTPWNFAVFRLPRPLPHMVADAKVGSSGLGWSLPVYFGRKQQVPLQGPATEYFRLFAAEGHHTEALAVFSPDLLESLIDRRAIMDLEIVDQWLFCYSQRGLDIVDPGTWEVLSMVEDLVVGRAASVVVAAPTASGAPAMVAPAGRRMTRTVSPIQVASFVIFGIMMLLMFVAFVT